MRTWPRLSPNHLLHWFRGRPFWQICTRLLPYIGSALIVWLLLRFSSIEAIWQLLSQVDPKWLLAGVGWYFITNICRAYRFGVLLVLPGWRRPLHLIPDMIALSFLNNVLPARAGELLF
ncbi:MAG: hypothetical protein GY792_29295, partial [Gammaproteobacteria bacterium]|nr:hypothetical protein [Gammaproteobacteria bacterium]